MFWMCPLSDLLFTKIFSQSLDTSPFSKRHILRPESFNEVYFITFYFYGAGFMSISMKSLPLYKGTYITALQLVSIV